MGILKKFFKKHKNIEKDPTYFVILALGNTGIKYAKSRHNVAWILLETIFQNIEWMSNKTKILEYYWDDLGTEKKVKWIKPLTMMNDSGRAIGYVKGKHPELKTENIIVIHDDISIPFGEVKVSFGKGDSHHNGVKSVTQHLKTKNYNRIRVGIESEERGQIPLHKFVLDDFSEKELVEIREGLAPKILSLLISKLS